MSYRKIILPAFFVALIILSGDCLRALAQEFPASWMVRSTYAPTTPGGRSMMIDWEYRASSSNSGVRVSINSVDSAVITRAYMFFDPDGLLYRGVATLSIRGADKQITRQFATNAPAVFTDALAPADWLNLNQETTRSLPQTRNARTLHSGRVTVSRTLTVTQQEISIAEAIDQGMLDPELADGLADPLVVFVVLQKKRDSQQEVLRQLWAPGDFWWLYESKGSRESMRLAN